MMGGAVPSELRVLRFQMDEITEALQAFAPRVGLSMPNKPIVWPEACPGANASQTRFKFVGCDTDLTMSNDMIAAGLISHCQANGIPLPRTWEKSISVATSYIELRVANLSGARPKEAGDTEAAALV